MLLFAAYEPSRRTAHGAIAACVQQRIASVELVADWLNRLKPLRRSPEFRLLLDDIGGGAQALSEVDLRRACREFGIAEPRGQTARRDRAGRRRWTDAEWDLPDGTVLVLEVDGAHHDVLQSAADKARHRRLTTRQRLVVSCSAYELRHDAASVMEDLIALGVPRTIGVC